MSNAAIKNNSKMPIEVAQADLPLHCPLPDDSLWDAHPRVFLDIEAKGSVQCPYCGANYILKQG